MKSYLTKCSCGRTTSAAYARKNGGKCKACVTGIKPAPKPYRSSSYDSIARDGGYEDTMGVSLDAYEGYRNGGSHGDY